MHISNYIRTYVRACVRAYHIYIYMYAPTRIMQEHIHTDSHLRTCAHDARLALNPSSKLTPTNSKHLQTTRWLKHPILIPNPPNQTFFNTPKSLKPPILATCILRVLGRPGDLVTRLIRSQTLS